MENRLDTSDIRELLRLAFELHDLRNNQHAAARAVLQRLCTMSNAAGGVTGVVHAKQPGVLSQVHRFISGTISERPRAVHRQEDPLLATLVEQARRSSRIGHYAVTQSATELTAGREKREAQPLQSAMETDSIYSVLQGDAGAMSAIVLFRPRLARQRWTQRDLTLLDVLHPEISWINRPAPAIPGARQTNALPPRQQQTLQLLLCGLSEKQISVELGVSIHTVHVYVKSIYRKFRVSTRSELLARWIERP